MIMEFEYFGHKVLVANNNEVICENKLAKELFEMDLQIALLQSEPHKGYLSGFEYNDSVKFVSFYYDSKKEEQEENEKIY